MDKTKGLTLKKVLRTVKKSWVGWLFVMPLVIGLAVFTFYPMLMSLVYSFTDFNGVMGGLRPMTFIDIGNYLEAFTFDRTFWPALGNTFKFAVISVPMSLVLSYLLALLLNKKVKGIGIYRLLIYLPCIIPGVVSGLIWRNTLDPLYGIANTWLEYLGVDKWQEGGVFIKDGLMWLEGKKSSFPTLIMTGLWGLGGNMILWLSALKNIPESVYEAARIDGAGPFVRLIRITVPMSTSMIFYNLITGIIGALQTFSTYNLGTSGGGSIYMYAVKIYEEAFSGSSFRYGYASALSWVLFVIIGLLTITVFRTSKWVYYGEEN